MGIYRAYIGTYTRIYRPFQSLPKFLLSCCQSTRRRSQVCEKKQSNKN
nr:MAG TPA: hypothetical protein [Caudoviricetes sp.]